jgi:hypothetical protein
MITRTLTVVKDSKNYNIYVKILNPKKIGMNFQTTLIIKGCGINFHTKLYGTDSMQSMIVAFCILKAKINQISNSYEDIFWLESKNGVALDI